MEPGLHFRQVAKSFSGKPVLRQLSADISLRGVTYVVGKSGSGKSVLCRLAVGLLRPDAGEVELNGQHVHRMSERALTSLRTQVPYVVQGPALLDWLTLEENVALADPQRSLPRAREALERVGLLSAAKKLPPSMSPGALKRAAIARALMLSPQFLLFDEPTTGLDAAAAQQVNAVILSLKHQGLGALVVSHDYRSLEEMADRVLVVAQGTVAFFGTTKQFIASDLEEVRALTRPDETAEKDVSNG